jgi:hypothetical protein
MKDILTNEKKFTVQDKNLHSKNYETYPLGWPTKKNTLHAGFRKRELERITKENYNILRRLQEK